MRQPLIAIALLVALVIPIAWIQDVDAHVLERDGSISAVLHMPPDDAPTAGKQTIVNLAFASADGRFDIANYQVVVEVRKGGQTVDTEEMQSLDRSRSDGTAIVTFPNGGAYQLVAKGVSKIAGSGFELSYDIRAGRAAGQDGAAVPSSAPGFDFWAICVGGWAVLAVVARGLIVNGGRYRK